MKQLIMAIQELHQLGLAHLNINPANLFIDYLDNLVVGDFGQALTLEDLQHSLIGKMFDQGTYGQKAPESILQMRET